MSEIREMYEKALEEKAEILEKIAPLRVQEEEIMEKIAPIQAELRKVREAIVDIERPRLAEVSRTIAALAPSQTRLKAEPGTIGIDK